MVYYRKEKETSFKGVAIRELTRFINTRPKNRNGKLFKRLVIKSKTTNWLVPAGYIHKKYNIDDVSVEFFLDADTKTEKIILQFHGGGYLMGLDDIYRDLAIKLIHLTNGNRSVYEVDYKTAPEHVYPAALNDALKVWNWLINEKKYKEENIVIIGDSAGGNLSLSLIAKLRDAGRKLPSGVITLSAWGDFSLSGESYTQNMESDPTFGKSSFESLEKYKKWSENLLTYAGKTKLNDAFLSPIYNDFHGFPPMLIHVSDQEIFLSDSKIIYQKAKEAKVDAKLTIFKGMFHVFQIAKINFKENNKAWREIINFINNH